MTRSVRHGRDASEKEEGAQQLEEVGTGTQMARAKMNSKEAMDDFLYIT